MGNVFITGADRGLGLSFVKLYLEKGHNVLAGQYMENSQGLDHLKLKYASKLRIIMLDISKGESVKSASKQTRKFVDHIDILINNAAILGDVEKSILEPLNFDEILEVINVNSLGPLRVINELVDLILESETKLIVNISSEAGSIGDNTREAWFGYCMSKSALNRAGALIHRKIMKEGGRVIQVQPGYMKSYMLGHFNKEASLDTDEAASKVFGVIEDQMKQALEEHPVYIDLYGEKLNW